MLELITEKIHIIEKEKYSDKLDEAEKIIGVIDKDDVPFIALALSMANDGIWTENVKHFGKQDKVKIWTTKELLSL